MAEEKISNDKKSGKRKIFEESREPKKEAKRKEGITAKIRKAVKAKETIPVKKKNAIEPYKILRFVLMTEKSVQNIELQNKLVFIVERKAAKAQIKDAAEEAFGKAVKTVDTMIDNRGRKKAFIRFSEEGAAGDIAVRLGVI